MPSFHGSGTSFNVVRGNFIGLAANGVSPRGNTLHGVFVAGQASDNDIGGTGAGEGNVIAHNGQAGVLIGDDPALGYNAAGSRNAVRGNRIFGNGGLGIDLGDNDGVTPNDGPPKNDSDSGTEAERKETEG